jgi:plasmid stabilization system protein ParE
MTNGRAKGARGERAAAKQWADALGLEPSTCRRGQQFAGGADSPDVVHPLGNIHLEVKRVEAGNPYVWLDQAIRDAGEKIPVVLHKRNRREWIAVLRLTDVKRLSEEIAAKTQTLGGGQVSCFVPGEGVPAFPG